MSAGLTVVGRHVRLVELSAYLLALVLRGHPYQRLESDWPTDARITAGHWDMDRQVMWLCVESSDFDLVPDGNTIPAWSPTFTVHDLAPKLRDLMAAHESATKT